MTRFSDDFILERMGEARITEFEPQFSLQDLVGKTMLGYRKIKNPREYDSTREGPNPEHFDVLLYGDDTFMVVKNEGDGGCAHLHFYYYDGERTLYSDSLYGIT